MITAMDRNHLKGRDGDRVNAVLAAVGYNFRLLLRWLEELLRALFQLLWHIRIQPASPNLAPQPAGPGEAPAFFLPAPLRRSLCFGRGLTELGIGSTRFA